MEFDRCKRFGAVEARRHIEGHVEGVDSACNDVSFLCVVAVIGNYRIRLSI